MWKESYRIGIDTIDEQHQQLFHMADTLMQAIQKGEEKDKVQEAVSFLKSYVIYHFKEEEAYQASIAYEGLKEHQKAHRDFTNEVLRFEERLIQSGYDMEVVKDLMGTLTAWLIYHVADADQKFAQKLEREPDYDSSQSHTALFSDAVSDVLKKMTALHEIKRSPYKASPSVGDVDTVDIQIDCLGAWEGSVCFLFTHEFSLRLFELLTLTETKEVDEMVCSALAEVANISSGNAARRLSSSDSICDIRPPVTRQMKLSEWEKNGGILLDTEIGKIAVFATEKQQGQEE